MLYANGPGFQGLYAGDSVRFSITIRGKTWEGNASVLPLLVFDDHVQVRYGACGYTVDASNFVRLVRRGRRHVAADKERTGFYTKRYVDQCSPEDCARSNGPHHPGSRGAK